MKLDFTLLARAGYPNLALSPSFTLTQTGAVSLDGATTLEVDKEALAPFHALLAQRDQRRASEIDFILETMAKNGMLIEADSSNDQSVSWLTLVHDLFHEINDEVGKYHRPESFIYRLIHKQAQKSEIVEWLKRCFQYTQSAYWHITGVVSNEALSEHERVFREQFRNDEENHWRIYTRIFKFLDIDIESLRKTEIQPDVARFTAFLRETGARSMFEYGALLYMMEIPPSAASLHDDPQFGALVNHYGFPVEAVQPLWDHACYNEGSGHEAIWFHVLRSKPRYSEVERREILNRARLHCLLSFNWNVF